MLRFGKKFTRGGLVEHFNAALKSMAAAKCLVVFGAGANGANAVIALKKRGIKIDFICDNDANKQGTYFFGVEVIAPESLVQKDGLVVFIASQWFHEIRAQLEKLGIGRVFRFHETLEFGGANTNFEFLSHQEAIYDVWSRLADDESRLVFLKRLE